jgi:hypothetical protein
MIAFSTANRPSPAESGYGRRRPVPTSPENALDGIPGAGQADGTFRRRCDYCSACIRRTAPREWHQTGAAMGLIISILITFLVIILVLYLINMLPIDGRAKQIVRVIVIIIGVLSLLKYLAIY